MPIRRATLLPLVILVAVLASCSEVAGPESDPDPDTPETEEPEGYDSIPGLPRQLSEAEHAVLRGSNAFAMDMTRRLLPDGPGENLFWSPLSATMALGMVLNGADGDTFDEIRDVLAMEGYDQAEINAGYRDLLDLLTSLDESVTVEIGNSTWTADGIPVRPDYQERVTDAFDAVVREVDFGDPATLAAINGWVDEATRGRIDRIFQSLPPNLVFVLLNAIYFQGDWTMEFDEERTEERPFTRPDGSTVSVQMMYHPKDIFHAQDFEDVGVVELPYGVEESFGMTIVIPHHGVALDDVVAELTPERWREWTGDFRRRQATVGLPRFELEWEAELEDPLSAAGMPGAFGSGADFGRLVEGEGIAIDMVKQKAFVKVDEKGTEAAASTGVGGTTSAPPSYYADRPFLFALRERLTGTILFMGVVNDPTNR